MAKGSLHSYLRTLKLDRSRVPSFDEYPYSVPAIAAMTELQLGPGVTFFVGENGSGKSTLIEALAVLAGFPTLGGSRNMHLPAQAAEGALHTGLKLVRGALRERDGFFLRAETFYNVGTAIDDYGVSGYGERSMHAQSHGESFLALAKNRFRGDGLYILDEPEAALSPQRQLAFLRRMHELVQKRSQLVIATHSPILLAYPGAAIYWLSPDGIEEVDYRETEHYCVTRDFLMDPERYLRHVLGE
jgi:predicted ATPase